MARKQKSRFRASFHTDPFGWSRYKENGKGYGEVGSLHKGPVDHVPWRFFNELVAGDVAQFVRLPIPPFAITRFEQNDDDGRHRGTLFSSIDFNYEREQPPLPDFDICMAKLSPLCAGVLLFDIVVANPDRTRDNIWCDNEAEPSDILIYDHDQALLGREHDGIERIKSLEAELGLRYFADGGNDFHPFLKRLQNKELLDDWYTRFYSIPKWFLHEICDNARSLSRVTKPDAKRVAEFLEYRTRNLNTIVNSHRAKFEGVADWTRKELFQ